MYALRELYKGLKKTVVALIENDNSPAIEYLESLDETSRKKMKHIMRLLAENGLLYNTELFRHLGNGIYEFKVHKPRAARILCFFDKNIIVCTHGCDKPGKRQLRNEIRKAIEKKRLYLEKGVDDVNKS